MLNNYVVSKSILIEFNGNHLSVGGCHNGIALAEGRKVNSLVNVILTGKGVFIRAKFHGYVREGALNGPDAWNFGEQGALGVKKRPNFLDPGCG
jgi:hypothetical protein